MCWFTNLPRYEDKGLRSDKDERILSHDWLRGRSKHVIEE